MSTHHLERSPSPAQPVNHAIAEPLTELERQLYKEHEEAIGAHLHTFVEIGERLIDIRERRLYREEFRTFEEYCRTRWQMSHQRASQLIQGAEVVRGLTSKMATTGCQIGPGSTEMGTTGSQIDPARILPTAERQTRELAKVPSEERVAVMREATKGGTVEPTARSIKLAAAKQAFMKRPLEWTAIQHIRRHGGEALADGLLLYEVEHSLSDLYAFEKYPPAEITRLAPAILRAGNLCTALIEDQFPVRIRSCVIALLKEKRNQQWAGEVKASLFDIIGEATFHQLVRLIGYRPETLGDLGRINEQGVANFIGEVHAYNVAHKRHGFKTALEVFGHRDQQIAAGAPSVSGAGVGHPDAWPLARPARVTDDVDSAAGAATPTTEPEADDRAPLREPALAAVEVLVKVLGEPRRAELLDRSTRGPAGRDLMAWAEPPFPMRIWKIWHLWKYNFWKLRAAIEYIDKVRAACLTLDDLADIAVSNYVGDFGGHYGGEGHKAGEPIRYHFKTTRNVFEVQIELLGPHCSGQGIQSLEQMMDDWFREARDRATRAPGPEPDQDTFLEELGDIPL
jgi:hypothetical protein